MKCLLTIEIQSLSCVITNATGNSKFEITDTKLYEPVVSLSTKNSRLVQVFIKSNGTSSKLQALSLSRSLSQGDGYTARSLFRLSILQRTLQNCVSTY